MQPNLIPTGQVTQVSYAAPGQPSLLIVAPSKPDILVNFQQRQSKIVGVILIVGGALSIVFHAISIHITATPNHSCNIYPDGIGTRILGHGIWNGALSVIAGTCGVIVAIGLATKIKITRFMVLTIVSASSCSIQLLFAVLSAVTTNQSLKIVCTSDEWTQPNFRCPDDQKLLFCRAIDPALAMDVLVATMAIIDGFVAIWGSAICCKVVLCGRANANPVYGMATFTYQQGGQVILQPCTVVAPTAAASTGGFIYQPPQLLNTSSPGPGVAPGYAALPSAPPGYDYA